MRTPFQFTVYYLWKATIARRTAAIMYTNIWQRFCVSYQWSYVKKKYKLNVTNFPFFCNC